MMIKTRIRMIIIKSLIIFIKVIFVVFSLRLKFTVKFNIIPRNKFVIYNNILSIILIILLLYSFDYSLGWGLNLIFPNIYFATFGTGNNGFDEFIWNENGVIEFFQILIIFAALVVLVNGFLNRKYLNLIKFLIIFQFFGLIYIFLEEISWGQHFFKFESPNLFLDKENFLYNKQGEFNFHNTSNLFNEFVLILVVWILYLL